MAVNTIHNDQKLRSIIQGCAANNRKCQEELYRQFFPTLERTIRRYTHDEDKVMSIMNNGFLKAFQNIHKYEYRGSFEGWLRKIIFRSVSDYMRSESKDVKFLVFERLSLLYAEQLDSRESIPIILKSSPFSFNRLLMKLKPINPKHPVTSKFIYLF